MYVCIYNVPNSLYMASSLANWMLANTEMATQTTHSQHLVLLLLLLLKHNISQIIRYDMVWYFHCIYLLISLLCTYLQLVFERYAIIMMLWQWQLLFKATYFNYNYDGQNTLIRVYFTRINCHYEIMPSWENNQGGQVFARAFFICMLICIKPENILHMSHL